MNIVKTFTSIICLFFTLNLVAQQASPTPLTLTIVLDSIEKIMDKQHIPGLLLTMATKDSILYDGGLGMADLEAERAVNPTQLFRMGSITKTFAALAMLKLEAAGKFSLTDDLKKVAPEIPFKNKWTATHPVKVIHLLEHTSGFDDMHFKAIYNKGDQELPTLEMVKLHKESLNARWQPGTRMSYTNPGFVVLGYLIEKFSGQTYHEYIKENFFTPIGMVHSDMTSFPAVKENYAVGYKYEGRQFTPLPFYPIHGGIAGTLNSCGADMAKYIQFYLNDGLVDSNAVIPSNWIKRMETASTSLAVEKGRTTSNYGLANTQSYVRERFPFQGHNGGIDGFSSIFNYNRDLGVGFSLSNNANRPNQKIAHLIIEFLTQDFTPPTPKSTDLNLELVKPFLGYYQPKSPRNQIAYPLGECFDGFELKLIDDTLYTVDMGGGKDKLIPVGGSLFRSEKASVPTSILTTDEAGKKVFIGRGYYEQGSLLGIWVQRILYWAGLLFGSTFSFFGLFWLGIHFYRKEASTAVSSVAGLFVGGLGLLLSFIAFILVAENITDAGVMNGKTIFYFISSILWAVGSIVGTYLLWKNFSSIRSKGLKYYLAIAALSLVGLAIYFGWHGFIGLRFWSY